MKEKKALQLWKAAIIILNVLSQIANIERSSGLRVEQTVVTKLLQKPQNGTNSLK
jgi:hypothetical protein